MHDGNERWLLVAAFEERDKRSVQAALNGKFFLRKSHGFSQFLYGFSECLFNGQVSVSSAPNLTCVAFQTVDSYQHNLFTIINKEIMVLDDFGTTVVLSLESFQSQKPENEEYVKLKIAESTISGNGVFAGEDIPKGAGVHILSGQVVSSFIAVIKIVLFQIRGDDPLQITKNKDLLLDNLSLSFNHSCTPNAGLRGVSELFALRPIAIGEEITYDYSTAVVPGLFTSPWSMKCRCKSIGCRSKIGSISTLPDHVLNYYMKEGTLQDYVKDFLKSKRKYEVAN